MSKEFNQITETFSTRNTRHGGTVNGSRNGTKGWGAMKTLDGTGSVLTCKLRIATIKGIKDPRRRLSGTPPAQKAGMDEFGKFHPVQMISQEKKRRHRDVIDVDDGTLPYFSFPLFNAGDF